MKKNEKGFTLIELLAVIVILAVIALIATPIIINVINDARKKAAIDGSYGVVKAIQLAYSQNQVSDGTIINANATVTFNGGSSILYFNGDNSIKPAISISGEVPSEGTATISVTDGNVSLSNAKIGSFYCNTYGNNNKVCCETTKDCNG